MIANLTRRNFLRTTAIATGAMLATPYVKSAQSAGKVSVALWDHWVPGANQTMQQIIEGWGASNNVAVVIDFLKSGTAEDGLAQTIAAEARDGSGHDLVWLWDWQATRQKEALEPVDEIVETLTSKYGPFAENASYLARHDDTWLAVAAACGSHSYPIVSRLDLWRAHAGLDLQAMFPARGRDAELVKGRTYQAFLEGCKKLHAAGYPFANPISSASDSEMWLAPVFLAFGSQLMTGDGNVTVDSDGTRAAL